MRRILDSSKVRWVVLTAGTAAGAAIAHGALIAGLGPGLQVIAGLGPGLQGLL